ncbi:hypothetical protein HYH03_003103 [Edaphochlamys debaryana]|uniref:Uncharacterized protein n=1 Tax=Edaphochlamys debaryana TaxID=47281 RepID=A0A836C4H6_9CHLO|nr:hypothetical protein HYH03_003103 [Edaphochlamys debaryana]|eukprot:KAG2498913.1 hypothetical protein HYH03_003103 [Edaphochlamys debaryana]
MDLPDALLHYITNQVLLTNRTGCLDLPSLFCAASTCRALRRGVHASLEHVGKLTMASEGRGACAAALAAVLPLLVRCRALDLRSAFRWMGPGACGGIAGVGTLTALHLDNCTQLTPAGVTALCHGRLDHLTHLSLRSAGDVGDGSVLSRLPALTSLDLTWCRSVQGRALAPFAARLKSLWVHGCELVDDTLCLGLAAGCPDGSPARTELLDVAFTRVGDAGLMAMALPRFRVVPPRGEHEGLALQPPHAQADGAAVAGPAGVGDASSGGGRDAGAEAAGARDVNGSTLQGTNGPARLRGPAVPRLRQLKLAGGTFNLWLTGTWTEAGLGEFQRLRPEVAITYF